MLALQGDVDATGQECQAGLTPTIFDKPQDRKMHSASNTHGEAKSPPQQKNPEVPFLQDDTLPLVLVPFLKPEESFASTNAEDDSSGPPDSSGTLNMVPTVKVLRHPSFLQFLLPKSWTFL